MTVDSSATSYRVSRASGVVLEPGTRSQREPGDPRFGLALTIVALVTVVLRLAVLRAPLSADESGFLQVAKHWHAGGGSLYGPYFVDRPPLLLELFSVADALGGVIAWRLIGAVAVAVTVVCVGMAARRVAGSRCRPLGRAGCRRVVWSPRCSGTTVPNGELVAAPFVAGGVWAAVTTVSTSSGPLRARAAGLTGACAAAALLVKQNMLDVVVFAVALGRGAGLAAAWAGPDPAARRRVGAGGVPARRRRRPRPRPGPGDEPGRRLLRDVPLPAPGGRGDHPPEHLAQARPPVRAGERELSSLGPVVLLALLVVLVARRLRPAGAAPVAIAVLVVSPYDVVSVVAGRQLLAALPGRARRAHRPRRRAGGGQPLPTRAATPAWP